MKKIMKVMIASLLMSSMFAILSFGATQRPDHKHIPPTDSILLPESQTYSKDTQLVLQRGAVISSCTAIISNEGGGKIGVFSQTRSVIDVDMGYITVFLDRWLPDESRWATQYFNEYEFYPVNGELHAMTVSYDDDTQKPGYYYRLWCYHEALKDNDWEFMKTKTDGIMITSHP